MLERAVFEHCPRGPSYMSADLSPMWTVDGQALPYGLGKGCRQSTNWLGLRIQGRLSIPTCNAISWIRRRRIANMPLLVVALPEQVGDHERAASFQSRNSHSGAVLET